MRIFKSFIICLLVCIPFFADAQNPFTLQIHRGIDTVNHNLSLNTGVGIAGNGTNLKLIRSAFNEQYISSTLVDKTLNQLSDNNNYGSNSELYLGYNFTNKLGSFHQISFSYNAVLGAKLNRETIKLALTGNADLEGKKIDLVANINQIRYSKIAYNYSIKKAKSIHSFGLGLLLGQSFRKINTENLTLFTAPFGDELSINGKANVNYLTYNGQLNIQGFGLTLNYSYRHKNDKNEFLLNVQDLGAISWQGNNRKSYEYNGNLSFSGLPFTIESGKIKTGTSGNGAIVITDTLKSLADTQQTGKSLLTTAPTKVFLSYSYQLSRNNKLTVYAYYQYITSAIPYLGLNYNKALSDKFNLGLGIYGGGSTYLGGLIMCNYSGDIVQASLTIDRPEYLVINNKGIGASVGLSIPLVK
ncbi:MAG: hypothetical protein SGJ04_05185 [Bacteroidota bacterium]|nr:hypothetical protein [Bacteroidota bacterium]